MCKLLEAEKILQFYSYDLDTAKADGAESDFLEAEAIIEQHRIERHDEMVGVRQKGGL